MAHTAEQAKRAAALEEKEKAGSLTAAEKTELANLRDNA